MVGGAARPVSGRRRKAVLAVLGLRAGEVVSTDRLVEIVWGDDAPATALNTLQRHVSYLRGMSGVRGLVVARGRGYMLDLEGDSTDVRGAETLIRESQQAVDPGQRVARLRAALALWRGEALVDVCDLSWLNEQARRLSRLRHSAVRALTEARLTVGDHAQLVPELQHLAEQHPYDEEVHRQLILALHRTGRPADALAAFEEVRRTLRDDLGVAPGPALRDLQAAILRQDRALDPPAAPITVAAPPAVSTPAQLPSAVLGFVGRERELSLLDGARAGARLDPPAGVVVAAVSGTAGVGKTALAIHWAHRDASRFPDGQLYVNLRGFDPGGRPADPSRVLHGFLQALGLPPARIPVDLEGRAAAYRSLLTGRRVLVVLDNARDAGQVRHLLPGSAGCFALITSRDRLTPLVATEGAVTVPLDPMSTADSRELLGRRLGADRVAPEPAAVAEIVERCAGLPLALVIVAARAASRPWLTLAQSAEELGRGAGALDALHGGDAMTDVRAVFLASYATLSRDAAALFRMLGVHPGPDIALAAAAAGAATPLGQARALMADLVRASLVTEQPDERFALHDLLRAYALELAELDESEPNRRVTLKRFLDHYVRHAYDCADLLEPHRGHVGVPRRLVDGRSEITNRARALAWYTAEHQVLVAAVERAAAEGFPTHAWHLAWTMTPFLHTRGYWQEQVTAAQAALGAARRAGGRVGQVHMLRSLAGAYAQLGEPDMAREHYQRALELSEKLGDHRTAARTHLGLAWIHERMGSPADGLPHAHWSMTLYKMCDDPLGETKALNLIGWTHALLGDYEPALRMCDNALARQRELGDDEGQAWTLDSLGYIHWRRGDLRRAIDLYQQAVGLFDRLADPYTETLTLINLGEVYLAAGDPEAARSTWRRALTTMRADVHPDADLVRAKLAAIR